MQLIHLNSHFREDTSFQVWNNYLFRAQKPLPFQSDEDCQPPFSVPVPEIPTRPWGPGKAAAVTLSTRRSSPLCSPITSMFLQLPLQREANRAKSHQYIQYFFFFSQRHVANLEFHLLPQQRAERAAAAQGSATPSAPSTKCHKSICSKD